MRSFFLILLIILVSCGRPHSSDQETNEVRQRERLEILSEQYEEIVGSYSGTLTLNQDKAIYDASLELRLIQDIDPSTGLPLQPKIVGSVNIYEYTGNTRNLLVSYGITQGSFDYKAQQVALDIADKLTIRGIANHQIIDAVLHSPIKGDIGSFKLTRQR